MPAADLGAARLDDGVVGMELAVGALEGLGDVLDDLHDGIAEQLVVIETARIADHADDGLFRADHDARLESACMHGFDEFVHRFGARARLDDDDHEGSP